MTTLESAVPTTAATGSSGGATLWLTGLPSAGKSTLARAVADAVALDHPGRAVEVLDGDEVRAHLGAGLGFSRADRTSNVARIGWLARTLARHGVLVLVPVIAPYADARQDVRTAHATAGTPYLEVHVATGVEVCAERDVKGLYAAQREGKLSGLTGVDDPYEPPAAPDLRLDTAVLGLEACVAELRTLLEGKGLL